MAVTLVIGAQWGDEGKGKIIDYLSKNADYIIRYHGGNNAGHTVINKFGTFAMHLIPSGIFNPKAKAVIANGVILDLEVLVSEIELLKKAKINIKNRLIISPRCHVIMPYHKLLDKAYEEAKGKSKIGTTGRGIGPCYADKVSYNGIRLADFFDKKNFRERLDTQLLVKNRILKSLRALSLKRNDIEKELFPLFKKLSQYIDETYSVLDKAIENRKDLLLEGAQGMFLDNDWGTYPFVTASTSVSGGVTSGAGINPKKIGRVIGVAKAYTTRVGSGPMPTEQLNGVGSKLQEEGKEFGVTTGRKRRCGWVDLEILRFAAKINGFSEIALTKLDVLDSFDSIKVCTHYSLNGTRVNYVDGDANFLYKVRPVYKTLKGWKSSTKGLKKFSSLPREAKEYIKEIEKNVGVKVTLVSTGQKRDEIIKV